MVKWSANCEPWRCQRSDLLKLWRVMKTLMRYHSNGSVGELGPLELKAIILGSS